MISAVNAISTARSLLGTPYSELDCINFVKMVIRTAPGGDPKYTDAHVPALWASYNSSGKYKHLTRQINGVKDAIPGMLAFKGQPLGRDHQPSHVGIVTGPKTVIHSSSELHKVVETDLLNGQWTLLGVSRWITPGDAAEETNTERDEASMSSAEATPITAAIVETSGGWLNVRNGKSTSSARIGALDPGERVTVLSGTGSWWLITANGLTGYVMSDYLRPVSDETPEEWPPAEENTEVPATQYTTLMNRDGQAIMLVGAWRVVED